MLLSYLLFSMVLASVVPGRIAVRIIVAMRRKSSLRTDKTGVLLILLIARHYNGSGYALLRLYTGER